LGSLAAWLLGFYSRSSGSRAIFSLAGRRKKREMGYVETFDDYVVDLKTFVDDVVTPTGHRRYVLLAHSMGGCVASLYLERHSGDFQRAVLSSPMHMPDLGRFDEVMYGVLHGKDKLRGDEFAPFRSRVYDISDVFNLEDGLTHSPTRWKVAHQEYVGNQAARLAGPSIHWVTKAFEAGKRACGNAGAIDIPILILQAGDDHIVENTAQKTFCETLNAKETPKK
jgi:lysophospholipase